MKLNDVYTKPLKDVVEELNLTDMKVHTDDDGEVRSIELKPEPPKPDPLLEARTSLAQAGFSAAAATYALRRFAEALKPEPLSHLTNNWRKMHGLPMHRKPASFRRRRKVNGTGKQSK